MFATLYPPLCLVFPVRFLLYQFGRYHLLYLWTTCMWVRVVLLFLYAHLLGLTHLVINSMKGLINILRWFDYVLITIISFPFFFIFFIDVIAFHLHASLITGYCSISLHPPQLALYNLSAAKTS